MHVKRTKSRDDTGSNAYDPFFNAWTKQCNPQLTTNEQSRATHCRRAARVSSAIKVHLFHGIRGAVRHRASAGNTTSVFHLLFRTHASTALDAVLPLSATGARLAVPKLRAVGSTEALRFLLIAESTGCLIVAEPSSKVTSLAVAGSPPITSSEAAKLDALRQLDQFRQWRSLDDKRYCLVCGNIITGRQVNVWAGTRDGARLRVSCATDGCNSIPMDWVLPTDAVLAKVERMTAEQSQNTSPHAPAAAVLHAGTWPDKQSHTGFASRWRKWGLLFRHSP